MKKEKAKTKDIEVSDALRRLLELADELEKSDALDKDLSRDFRIKPPYSSGKRPEPTTWEENGIQRKLA